eukprot:UN04649
MDSTITFGANSACLSLADPNNVLTANTNSFSESHSYNLAVNFDVEDTVYFQTSVVSVLASNQEAEGTSMLNSVIIYQEAPIQREYIAYENGATTIWGNSVNLP